MTEQDVERLFAVADLTHQIATTIQRDLQMKYMIKGNLISLASAMETNADTLRQIAKTL